MSLYSGKQCIVTLEKKLEVIAMTCFKVMDILKKTDTTWSHTAQISGVRLCSAFLGNIFRGGTNVSINRGGTGWS